MKKTIEALKAQADEAGPRVRALSNKGMKAMKSAPRDLKKKAAEYAVVGRKKWKDLASNVRHDVKGIVATVKALVARKG